MGVAWDEGSWEQPVLGWRQRRQEREGGEAALASGWREEAGDGGGKRLWGAGRGVWLAAALGAGVAARAGRCLSVKVLGDVILTFLMPRAGWVTVGVCCSWVEEDNMCRSHMGQGVAMPALGALPRMSKSQSLPCPSPSPLARVCARCACVCASIHVPAAALAHWRSSGCSTWCTSGSMKYLRLQGCGGHTITLHLPPFRLLTLSGAGLRLNGGCSLWLSALSAFIFSVFIPH